ncbi:hypothetical protein [Sphingosinicella sp. BN140058]|uniref:hypothetical protein n=1 Tax=Sphingosinicella sp. BN140058 TaxID=1892855 RepID=UPI001013A542|nr:hypothetical protein [Sphingosinicella sp. BN140058]QAY76276.1 hypothetical protein ETR14_06845 [Sphingosinicella sp. BN140058]
MKPSDLFIGVRDVLALLVPGAVLLLLLPIDAIRHIARAITYAPNAEIDATLLLLSFLVLSLAAGSLLAALAGQMDRFVDRQVETDLGDLRFLPGRRRLGGTIRRMKRLAGLASQLRDRVIGEHQGLADAGETPWSARAFWWTYLRLNCPEAISELDRVEGFQKQFRSLTLVFAILAFSAFGAPVSWAKLVTSGPDRALPDAFAGLLAAEPWLLFFGAAVAACLCFLSYAAYRVTFSIRLFEFALIRNVTYIADKG